MNMIKADLYRILKGKAIYICMLVILFVGFVSALSVSPGHIGISISANTNEVISDPEFAEKMQNTNSLGDLRELMLSYGAFALDKEVIGQNINLYYIFIVITVIVLCSDFSNRTIKNTLSSAISRKKYYFSKLITIFMLSTFLLLFSNISTVIIIYLVDGKDFISPFSEILKLTVIQLPLIYGIISLLIGLGFVTGKTSIFNTISIPFILVVQLIGFGIINLFRIKADWFYDYEIQFALSKLATDVSNNYIIKCALLGLAYIVVFNIIGYFVFKRKEIK